MHLPTNYRNSHSSHGWNYKRTDDELRSFVANLHERVASVDLEISL